MEHIGERINSLVQLPDVESEKVKTPEFIKSQNNDMQNVMAVGLETFKRLEK